jgi:hypothetical protein
MANKPGINNLFNIFEGMNAFGAGPGARTRSLLDTIDPVTGKPLITQDAIEKANRQSIGTGIVTGLASYLAQPKNKGYGSAVPYLAQSYLQANKAAQAPFQGVADQYLMDTQLKEQQRVLGERTKTQGVIDQMITLDPSLKDLKNAPIEQQIAAINENTKQRFVVPTEKKALSPKDKAMETLNLLITKDELNKQNPSQNPPLSAKDKANKIAAQTILTYTSSDVSGAAGLTKPQEKALETQGKDFTTRITEWSLDGQGQSLSLISTLEEAVQLLESDTATSGPYISKLSDAQKSIFAPSSLDVDDKVKSVAQLNLRKVLGAQFGEKEGELMMQRAYNPALPPEVNVRRVKKVLFLLKQNQETMNAAANHYRENKGDMSTFKGKVITKEDFYNELGPMPTANQQKVTLESLQTRFPDLSTKEAEEMLKYTF